jgi:hypothetical protein
MEVLLRIWAGLSWHGITHKYTVQELTSEVTYRKLTAEQAGRGPHMPTVGPKLPVVPIAPKTEVGNFWASA